MLGFYCSLKKRFAVILKTYVQDRKCKKCHQISFLLKFYNFFLEIHGCEIAIALHTLDRLSRV